MRKSFTCMIAAAIALAFGLVACGDVPEATKPTVDVVVVNQTNHGFAVMAMTDEPATLIYKLVGLADERGSYSFSKEFPADHQGFHFWQFDGLKPDTEYALTTRAKNAVGETVDTRRVRTAMMDAQDAAPEILRFDVHTWQTLNARIMVDRLSRVDLLMKSNDGGWWLIGTDYVDSMIEKQISVHPPVTTTGTYLVRAVVTSQENGKVAMQERQVFVPRSDSPTVQVSFAFGGWSSFRKNTPRLTWKAESLVKVSVFCMDSFGMAYAVKQFDFANMGGEAFMDNLLPETEYRCGLVASDPTFGNVVYSVGEFIRVKTGSANVPAIFLEEMSGAALNGTKFQWKSDRPITDIGLECLAAEGVSDPWYRYDPARVATTGVFEMVFDPGVTYRCKVVGRSISGDYSAESAGVMIIVR